MVKKSTDYIKLRKVLDEGKIIPMTFGTLYDDEVKYCYGSKTNYRCLTNDYEIGNYRCPVTISNDKFVTFCTLYEVEFEEPLKIE